MQLKQRHKVLVMRFVVVVQELISHVCHGRIWPSFSRTQTLKFVLHKSAIVPFLDTESMKMI